MYFDYKCIVILQIVYKTIIRKSYLVIVYYYDVLFAYFI